ncbi:ATP-binding protein [Streptomyces sp. NRRL S-1022]|uniref:ATP-binding protein n=1 Tax=Streptomyces sp. NRRL S-1022 TaxID=1463880 RepID=UPI0005619FFC|nr:ATP-binding protein [Streptomyces sp. NRRL S-1022]
MHVTPPHLAPCVRAFSQLLSSTRRGARLARLLAVGQLRAWQVPPAAIERAEQIVAELAANAALHGRVQDRDFRVSLTLDTATGALRIAVTDARGEQPPRENTKPEPTPDAEDGRGLLLVTALADRWSTDPYPAGGKTVWAELRVHEPFPG